MKELGRFDAIIVGARIAGTITAAALARLGWKVLIVDRARFPSSTLSTHLFFSDTLRVLRELDLVEPILAVDAPRLRWLRFPYVAARFPQHDGFDFALCIRREVLDTLLVEQLRSRAGVTLLTQATVKEVVRSQARISGVVIDDGRQRWTARAPLVIGADGRNSIIARSVGAGIESRVPPLFAWYYTYFVGVPIDPEPAALAFRGDYPELGAEYAAAFLFPCDGGLTLVGYGVEHRAFAAFRTDVRRHFFNGLRRIPDAWERVTTARQVAPIRGTGQLPNFLRQASGPGWALVGDAGCHKDPHTVQGMGDAARSAWLLAQELARSDPEDRALDQAVARYALKRDQDLRPMYDFTTFQLRSRVPEDVWEQFEARTRVDPKLAELRVAAMVHAVDPAVIYTPERVQAIAAGSSLDAGDTD
jgi:flavin-dependent dehydrogenase|uniref:NAD(P)/FAD-dependent oxidoreductase n=1 Tax=Thermomicrobium roseum TaxID=500 RepID=A0A7C1X0F8_THERO